MNMKTKTPAIFIGILFLTGCQNLKEVDTTVYMDPSRPVEERVEALLEQMTLEEKSARWIWFPNGIRTAS